jgi:hypothetical protein
MIVSDSGHYHSLDSQSSAAINLSPAPAGRKWRLQSLSDELSVRSADLRSLLFCMQDMNLQPEAAGFVSPLPAPPRSPLPT